MNDRISTMTYRVRLNLRLNIIRDAAKCNRIESRIAASISGGHDCLLGLKHDIGGLP
jgi:hypothetical protein